MYYIKLLPQQTWFVAPLRSFSAEDLSSELELQGQCDSHSFSRSLVSLYSIPMVKTIVDIKARSTEKEISAESKSLLILP